MSLNSAFGVSMLDQLQGAARQGFMLGALLLLALASPVLPADMVRIPAGVFTMESDLGPDDERPAHQVTLATFEIDLFPVTNTDFAQFLNASGLVTLMVSGATMTMTMMRVFTALLRRADHGKPMSASGATPWWKPVGLEPVPMMVESIWRPGRCVVLVAAGTIHLLMRSPRLSAGATCHARLGQGITTLVFVAHARNLGGRRRSLSAFEVIIKCSLIALGRFQGGSVPPTNSGCPWRHTTASILHSRGQTRRRAPIPNLLH
jgi:Sulfatase-modifying factor enzyme 1